MGDPTPAAPGERGQEGEGASPSENGSETESSTPDQQVESAEDGRQSDLDGFFDQPEREIFKDKQKVRVGWVPEGNRIVGRQDYIDTVKRTVRGAVFGKIPGHLLITGKTGTGKSLVSRYVCRQGVKEAPDDVVFDFVYLDCSQDSAELDVVTSIGQTLNNESLYDIDEDPVNIPDTGLPMGKFYDRIWEVFDRYDSAIIILDEVDLLSDDKVLRNLAKAVESGSTRCNIGLIAISNTIDYYDHLEARTKSAFDAEEVTFSPYDANQLREILYGREDAFHDGALTDDIVPLVAVLSAQDHGDARKAMKLFRWAGETAVRKGAPQVKEDHVYEAQDQIIRNKFHEFISDAPTQMKAVSLALALTSEVKDGEPAPTGSITQVYELIIDEIDLSPLSSRHFRDTLEDMSLANIARSDQRNLGSETMGLANVYTPIPDTEVVIETVLDDTRFEGVDPEKIKEIASDLDNFDT